VHNTLTCIIIEKSFCISCNETIPPCGFQMAFLLLFVYFLRCISVYFLLYKFERLWAEECFKYMPGRAVLSYIKIFIYP